MNILQQKINEMGLKLPDVSKRTGIKYGTVFRHVDGSRTITGEMAIKYEKGLGIPREELRPDLFADFRRYDTPPAP